MSFHSLGLRTKLVLIFIVIKVIPLILLAWIAWKASDNLSRSLSGKVTAMSVRMSEAIREVGQKAVQDSTVALDERSRKTMERQTADIARALALFLYDRDNDIRSAALLEPDDRAYRRFLQAHVRPYRMYGRWALSPDGQRWIPDVRASSPAPPGKAALRPLYLEMSFVGLDGHERVKVATGLTDSRLKDVRFRANTFVRAETYWPALQHLKPGQIYVSDVIGAYVGSRVLGTYTPQAAASAGIAYAPEKSAYAGAENPVGRRFRGLVRWATPVERGGQIIGYVTLALDHEHIRQFVDQVDPAGHGDRLIADASRGNYAFLWDRLGRSIAHPRDYMIVGYDPATGRQVPPWMDKELYAAWQASGQEWSRFARHVEPYHEQSAARLPAMEMVRRGMLGLDCRYLNFVPQCAVWDRMTGSGKVGSVEIEFDGLRKLVSIAPIPYFSGQYGASLRGFGSVTVGAGIEDFHRPAMESARQINEMLATGDASFREQRDGLVQTVADSMHSTTRELIWVTLLMIVLVIGVAFWMAGILSRRIRVLAGWARDVGAGHRERRLRVYSGDEMGQLAGALNRMADSLEDAFRRSEDARLHAETANRSKSEFLANVSHELRTPLNGILGFAELLEMDLADPVQREHAQTIKNSGKHLLGVVNELLDVAKSESGKMLLHPEPIDLQLFVPDVVQLHKTLALGKGLDFVTDLGAGGVPLPCIQVDPVRLRQILNNLINNAIRYTDQGYVKVRVEVSGPDVLFRISDSGCGIDPQNFEAIFEKFGTVGGKMQRDKGGTGLGLSLVRNLAHLMGGHILVESEPGSGSTFTLAIPVVAPQSQGIR